MSSNCELQEIIINEQQKCFFVSKISSSSSKVIFKKKGE
ncbi:hypothetical protein GvMRE_IIg303 [endosymbiont GvMRE of Glomus versiforme]|nr:hypothetical protein GvMRE_IIg303 [endosymbiont GvMRE of Glomus versiforme]